MNEYQIAVRTVYSEVLTVGANSKEEALELFKKGEGVFIEEAAEYERQLTDPDDMDIRLIVSSNEE